MKIRTMTLITFGSLLCVTAVALATFEGAVTYNGKVMSRDIVKVNGKAYIALADVAKALDGRVAAHGGSYEIISGSSGEGSDASRNAPGGANEVKGQNGKVGDWFFNGEWRFQAKTVERMNEYNFHFSENSGKSKSAENDELVVVTCTMKNGQQTPSQPTLTSYGLAAQKTALTDDQGQSYAPIDFDHRNGALSPGAARSFAVIFSVPKGTHLKDMIFTLYGTGSSKLTDIRVSMRDL